MQDANTSKPCRRIELAADVYSATYARQFVRETLTEWNRMDIEGDVSLAVTELVTNSVVHAHSPAVVTLINNDGVVHVRVRDNEPTHPHLVHASESDTGGRGLLIVEAVSSSWGIDVEAPGKVVWLDIRETKPVESTGALGLVRHDR